MSSLGLELIKNINIEENNLNQTKLSTLEKPHVQFKETNEIIEPSESSQVDSTTIINNDNPLFKNQSSPKLENIINYQNESKQESNQESKQESNQEDSVVITFR